MERHDGLHQEDREDGGSDAAFVRAASRRGTAGESAAVSVRRCQDQSTLEAAIAKIEGYLQVHDEKVGSQGRIKQSNITDNESAKMRTAKGVVQGYTGVALVDQKHQMIVNAAAFGEGQEHGLLIPVIEGARENLATDPFRGAACWPMRGTRARRTRNTCARRRSTATWPIRCSENGTRALRCRTTQTDAGGRAVRKAEAGSEVPTKDFAIAPDHSHAICPAGKRLYRSGRHRDLQGYESICFRGNITDCGSARCGTNAYVIRIAR